MELIRLAGLCAACLMPVALLRKKAPEHALVLTAAVLAVVLARCLGAAAPALARLEALFGRAGLESARLGILLRLAGASVAARLCADLCRDGGSQAMASAVETAGSLASLLIALPLLEAVVGLLLGYFA